ncbi:MAG: hypothetical protein AB7E79_04690 [Rhodospirillaceae bacterium]
MTLSYVEGADGEALTELTAGFALRGGSQDENRDEDEEEDDDGKS